MLAHENPYSCVRSRGRIADPAYTVEAIFEGEGTRSGWDSYAGTLDRAVALLELPAPSAEGYGDLPNVLYGERDPCSRIDCSSPSHAQRKASAIDRAGLIEVEPDAVDEPQIPIRLREVSHLYVPAWVGNRVGRTRASWPEVDLAVDPRGTVKRQWIGERRLARGPVRNGRRVAADKTLGRPAGEKGSFCNQGDEAGDEQDPADRSSAAVEKPSILAPEPGAQQHR